MMRSRVGVWAVLAGVVVVSGFLGLALGPTLHGPLSWLEACREPDGRIGSVVWNLRMPRVLAGYLVGACLGLAGLVYQGVFRNPLAEPFLLGSAAGASIGAAFALLLEWGVYSLVALPVFSFVGALGASLLVLLFASLGVGRLSQGVLLAGVALAAVLSAVRGLILLALAEPGGNLQVAMSWMMGGISISGYGELALLGALTVVAFVLTRRLGSGLDLLGFGEDVAYSMGLRVRRFTILAVLVASLATAVAISWGGLIGFVGLVAPHVCRWWVGPSHRALAGVTAVVGGALLVFVDGWSRYLLAPSEIPVGLLTALIGGPFFLYLLWRLRSS